MQAKVKTKGASQPLVISANRLLDGAVVWLAEGDLWRESLSAAQVFQGEAVEAGMAAAEQAEREQKVVGGYVVEVTLTPDGPLPVRARERFRAAGPSIALPSAA